MRMYSLPWVESVFAVNWSPIPNGLLMAKLAAMRLRPVDLAPVLSADTSAIHSGMSLSVTTKSVCPLCRTLQEITLYLNARQIRHKGQSFVDGVGIELSAGCLNRMDG